MKTITQNLIDDLLKQAAQNDRKRINFNLHTDLNDPIHRFCIAATPETVFKPHRHPGKWELITVLRGTFTVETYDMNRKPIASYEMSPDGLCVLEMPDTVYHKTIVHTPCAFLEAKPGPYEKPEDMN